MATNHERIGGTLVFSAGSGEWFDQPGKYLWDMGEDAEPRPPSQWHMELRQAIDTQKTTPRQVVVDVTRMAFLVGVDWGFLITMSKQLSQAGVGLAVAGGKNVVGQARIAKLSQFFEVCSSVDEAMSKS